MMPSGAELSTSGWEVRGKERPVPSQKRRKFFAEAGRMKGESSHPGPSMLPTPGSSGSPKEISRQNRSWGIYRLQ